MPSEIPRGCNKAYEKQASKHSLHNEITADLNELNPHPNTQECNHDSDSSYDDITKCIKFPICMKSVEQEIMQLYKEKSNIDPIHDNTYKIFTEE